MYRARSCIIACGHASMRYVVAYLLSSWAVGPTGGSSQQPLPDGSSQQPLLDGSVGACVSRVRTRPLRYCARSSHRCAVMHHSARSCIIARGHAS
eukprot:scaffold118108_cov36-Phaeocystis_antarctica.AAC.1